MSADINYKSNFVSYVLADRDVILFVYEVPFIFWHYINVGEVRWITLKTLLQSAMELLQNCNSFVYFKVRWTVITNCDSFFITTVRHGLLQIATGILKCDKFITNCDGYYKVRWLLQIATVRVLIPCGARVAQWWEHSPPTSVTRARILASTPYVGWVCCWFSPLLWEVFLRVLQFSPFLKNQHSAEHFQIPIRRSRTYGYVSTSS